MKLKTLFLSITLLISMLLSACSHKENANSISVGVMAGAESDLMVTAAQVAKQRYNLNVKVVTFTDYTMLNEALNDGNIDANMFQHVPYLNAQIQARGYNLIPAGNGFVYPIGVYALKLKKLQDIPVNGKIAIPNDPSNEARSLLLIQSAGLITLRSGAGTNATVVDIASNPKHIHFIELDSAQLPRALQDVDAAIINDTYAGPAGLKLSDAIYKEGPNSPYVNVLVVQKGHANDPHVKQLLAAFQSQAVIDKAKQLFGDGAVPAFVPTT